MKFLFIETYYSGSHARFADGLKAASSHTIDLVTLPGENWQWRMMGSALYLARKGLRLSDYDGLIVTDLFNLADFLAMTGPCHPPVMAYFHENQLTYPPPPGDKNAALLGMINISTALAAETVAFNSAFHMKGFIQAVSNFLEQRPDCRPDQVAVEIARKSMVLYPAIDTPPPGTAVQDRKTPPLIIWNHRWSYDKKPALFFAALSSMIDQGLDFRVALLGENSGKTPPGFESAPDRLGARLVHAGYVPSRCEYHRWMQEGAVAVSTAIQENFGLSMAEAVAHGCLPLAPHALSYPEIIPAAAWEQCLYKGKKALVTKLARLITGYRQSTFLRRQLTDFMHRFTWENRIIDIDRALESLAGKKRSA